MVLSLGIGRWADGPGILLLHGGAKASQSLMQLGKALSDDFTVYIPDRRGRGLSGPFGDNYGLEREVEDMDALLKKNRSTKCLRYSNRRDYCITIGARIACHP